MHRFIHVHCACIVWWFLYQFLLHPPPPPHFSPSFLTHPPVLPLHILGFCIIATTYTGLVS